MGTLSFVSTNTKQRGVLPLPSISVTSLFNFNRIKVTFSELAEQNIHYCFNLIMITPTSTYYGFSNWFNCSSLFKAKRDLV